MTLIVSYGDLKKLKMSEMLLYTQALPFNASDYSLAKSLAQIRTVASDLSLAYALQIACNAAHWFYRDT